MYPLVPLTVQNLTKILGADLKLTGSAIFGPKVGSGLFASKAMFLLFISIYIGQEHFCQ